MAFKCSTESKSEESERFHYLLIPLSSESWTDRSQEEAEEQPNRSVSTSFLFATHVDSDNQAYLFFTRS